MKYSIEENTLYSIGDAIRSVTKETKMYTPLEMASAISSISISGGSSAESIQWHQCPEMPRKFVAEVAYDPADYSTSSIADYAPATPVKTNTKPIGKTAGNKTFYNETPGLETPFIADTVYGTIKPLDPVRWINTPNALNARDLGGWACDGGTVKYGLLFRGGEPTSNDRAVLVEELDVRHDLNLRGKEEAPWKASPLGEDIYFTRADNYNWYAVDVNEGWKINLRCVFDAVTHREPVYFHCAAGADRTGTLACILEGLLGVSQSDIDKEYELTNFYSGTGADAQARRRNETEWMGLITAINAKDGNTFRDKCVTFAVQLGFTAAEINAYRKAMIDGTPETVMPDTTGGEQETTPTNQMSVQSTNINKRISGNGNIVDCSGCFVCDPIPVDLTKSCPVTFKGFASNMATLGTDASYENSKLVLMDTNQSPLATWYISHRSYTNEWIATVSGDDVVGDLQTVFDQTPVAGTAPDASNVAYVQFAPQISLEAITTDNLSGLEILM